MPASGSEGGAMMLDYLELLPLFRPVMSAACFLIAIAIEPLQKRLSELGKRLADFGSEHNSCLE